MEWGFAQVAFYCFMQLTFYFTLYKGLLYRSFVFLENLLPYFIVWLCFKWLVGSVAPTTKFRAFAMFYYLLCEMQMYDFRVPSSGLTAESDSIIIRLAVRIESCGQTYGRTDMHTYSALYTLISYIQSLTL